MFLLACRNVAGQRVKVISSNFCCSTNPSQVQILSPKCERWWKSKHQEDALHQPWGASLTPSVECGKLVDRLPWPPPLRVECWRLIWTSSCLLHRQPALVGRGFWAMPERNGFSSVRCSISLQIKWNLFSRKTYWIWLWQMGMNEVLGPWGDLGKTRYCVHFSTKIEFFSQVERMVLVA